MVIRGSNILCILNYYVNNKFCLIGHGLLYILQVYVAFCDETETNVCDKQSIWNVIYQKIC